MSRMAVCYFCGDVLESPDPTPILPPDLRDGDGPTVDLCPACDEKFDRIHEVVAAAAEGADAGASEPESPAAEPDAAGEESGDGGGLDDLTFDGPAEPDEGATPDLAGEGADLADVSVSREDFRRVLRLLENRDLPIERDEIESVASNAYDVPRETTSAIVDAAVERGDVAVEGDHIVEAE